MVETPTDSRAFNGIPEPQQHFKEAKMSRRRETKRRTAPIAGASKTTPQPREVRECLIALGLTQHRPHSLMPFTQQYLVKAVWGGLLFDPDILNDPAGGFPIGKVVAGDNTTESRDCVISSLTNAALESGYTHFEVRDYQYGESASSYVTLFKGPVLDLDVASL